MEEIWKDIQGYEGLYQVSNMGRIRRINRFKDGSIRLIKYKKRQHDNHGYPIISLCQHGKQSSIKIHRLVAEAFVPNPEGKPEVNHIDGNKDNDCVENLEWVTHQENIIHAHKNGLTNTPKGEEHYDHRLTWNDVHYIREHYVKGSKDLNQKYFSQMFGVSRRIIGYVVQNKTWKE